MLVVVVVASALLLFETPVGEYWSTNRIDLRPLFEPRAANPSLPKASAHPSGKKSHSFFSPSPRVQSTMVRKYGSSTYSRFDAWLTAAVLLTESNAIRKFETKHDSLNWKSTCSNYITCTTFENMRINCKIYCLGFPFTPKVRFGHILTDLLICLSDYCAMDLDHNLWYFVEKWWIHMYISCIPTYSVHYRSPTWQVSDKTIDQSLSLFISI